MNTTLLKIFTVVMVLAGFVFALVLGSPTAQRVQARGEVAAHQAPDSKVMPAGPLTLGKDSTSEYGEVPFDHNTHSFNKYSPDGKTDIGCAECHHTDQPKSALKPPLVTSEREVVLTLDELKKDNTPVVKGCRTCHFQESNIPEGKEMPFAVYKKEDGTEEKKDLNNELAYHNNCNTCHDAAAKLRPELKKKAGFATSTDCLICHKKN